MKIQGFDELLREKIKNINNKLLDEEENLQTSLKYINNKSSIFIVIVKFS